MGKVGSCCLGVLEKKLRDGQRATGPGIRRDADQQEVKHVQYSIPRKQNVGLSGLTGDE